MSAIISERATPAWAEAVDRLHTGTVADVLDGCGHWGVLDWRVRPANAIRPVLAQALTVRWKPVRKPQSIVAPQPSTWEQVRDFLAPAYASGHNLAYVAGVDDGLQHDLALAGGFSATDMQKRGFAAMVLGGAIRDAHVVTGLDLPVWATNFTPADTQGNYEVAEVGGHCTIGRVVIHTGDWVLADASGIVVVPQAIADAVFERALEIESVEGRIGERTAAGENLNDVVKELGRL
ncbi:RraA family protein [Pseudoduganella armeniaca]|nr:RraA family protein [Pseudoduganella armeniaca]